MIDFARSDPARSSTIPPSSSRSPDGYVRLAEARARRREQARLGDEIARLSAHIQAATYRLLELIRAFDASGGWHAEGFLTCAGWLSWRTGIAPGAAREKVRVARALGELPVLSAALERGQLSYSVARAITRVATPDNEAALVEGALHATAAQMERLVAGLRVAERAELGEKERHEERALWVIPEADGSWTLRGRLTPEVGALLCRALEAAGEALRGSEGFDGEEPAAARRADALGLVAESALAKGRVRGGEAPVSSRAERFQVVVHVSAETLSGQPAGGDADGNEKAPGVTDAPWIEGGPHVSAETSRRLACDAAMVEMKHDPGGNALDVGRRRRTVPPALRRALDHRDRGCRFPGCVSRFCDAHHITHWARGGATRLPNLVLLCRRHHRLVHEECWNVSLDPGGEVRFHRPDGSLLPAVAPASAVPSDPVAALEHRNRDLGIDAWTATPSWAGDRLDLDYAVMVFAGRSGTQRDISAETFAGRTVDAPGGVG
jgi:hypothetical protein